VSATEYFVRDIMTYEAVTVEPTSLLLDAALTLRAGSIRHLLVVENGLLVGVLSDRDVQRCAPSRLMPVSEEDYNAVFADTTVNRVMTRNPQTVSSTTPLAEAIATMQQSRLGCLPVVDEDKLVGLLTRSDLVDALQRVLLGKPIAKAGEG
jgi:acetoin utilization protein AcuB